MRPQDDRLTPASFYCRVVPALTALGAAIVLAGIGFFALAFCRSCGWLVWGGLLKEWIG